MIRKTAAVIDGSYTETRVDCGPGRYRPKQMGRAPDSTGAHNDDRPSRGFAPAVHTGPGELRPAISGTTLRGPA